MHLQIWENEYVMIYVSFIPITLNKKNASSQLPNSCIWYLLDYD